MFGFIAAGVLFSYTNTEGMIPLTIIPIWFFSFFDSYAIRRRVRNGEAAEDNVIFDYKIILENKRIVGIAVLILGILGIINAFEYSILQFGFGRLLYSSVKRSVISIVLVATGIYILTKSRKNEKEAESVESAESMVE